VSRNGSARSHAFSRSPWYTSTALLVLEERDHGERDPPGGALQALTALDVEDLDRRARHLGAADEEAVRLREHRHAALAGDGELGDEPRVGEVGAEGDVVGSRLPEGPLAEVGPGVARGARAGAGGRQEEGEREEAAHWAGV
jgi:hypothetical protein